MEIRWINGQDNPADAMTKPNPNKALERFITTKPPTGACRRVGEERRIRGGTKVLRDLRIQRYMV
jgi:hypothetical protein